MNIQSDNLYEILCLDKDCTLADIKNSYKRLVKIYHPDKLIKNCHLDEDNSMNFLKIHNAYTTLSDSDLRKKYDLSCHAGDRSYIPGVMKTFWSTFMKSDVKNYLDNLINTLNSKKYATDGHLDIHVYTECDIVDRFLDKNVDMNIQTTYCQINKTIYFRNDITIFEGDGNIDENEYGNIVVHVDINNKHDFVYVKSDMYKHIYISQNDFDDDKINFIHLDDRFIKLTKNMIVYDKYIILPGEGFPKNTFVHHTKTDEKISRGDLILEIHITP